MVAIALPTYAPFPHRPKPAIRLVMNEETAYQQRLDQVRAAIADACAAAGRPPQDVRLLPVSKTHPIAALQALHSLGLQQFGENYAQELVSKAAVLGNQLEFVFIGTLQSNKIKRIVEAAAEIQTLVDIRHARLIASAAREFAKSPYPVYLAVNAGDESTKTGIALDQVEAFAQNISENYPEIALQGLMAIPPPLENLATATELADPNFVPPLYRSLAQLARRIGRGQLSLGMSQDLRPAILAGSNCVRIGTALFGPRG